MIVTIEIDLYTIKVDFSVQIEVKFENVGSGFLSMLTDIFHLFPSMSFIIPLYISIVTVTICLIYTPFEASAVILYLVL